VIGVVAGAVIIPPILDLLNRAYGFAGATGVHHEHPLPAPQAGLISALAQGVIQNNVDWSLIEIGGLIGVGIIAATISRSFAPALAFSVAMIAGVALHLARAYLPAAELLVGLSTLAVGLSIVASSRLGVVTAGGLLAMAGLVHGYALGESIVGAESTPLGAYLVGLLVVQSLLAGGAFALASAVASKETALRRLAIVAAGALIAVVGGSTIASAPGIIG